MQVPVKPADGGQPMIGLREANAAEWAAVAEITRLANDEYSPSMDENFWRNYEESTRNMLLTEQDVLRFVAVADGAIAGSVVYCPPYERELAGKAVRNPYPEMRLLSVLPAFRNRGIAAALIDMCEQRAIEEGVGKLTLHTTPVMSTAKAMYERRGYERYPEIDFEPARGFTVLGYIKNLEGESCSSKRQ